MTTIHTIIINMTIDSHLTSQHDPLPNPLININPHIIVITNLLIKHAQYQSSKRSVIKKSF